MEEKFLKSNDEASINTFIANGFRYWVAERDSEISQLGGCSRSLSSLSSVRSRTRARTRHGSRTFGKLQCIAAARLEIPADLPSTHRTLPLQCTNHLALFAQARSRTPTVSYSTQWRSKMLADGRHC